MQIASPVTTSTLKVTVRETDTNNYPAFSCTPIIKKIPSMMWKKCKFLLPWSLDC
ncbi:hypothetical protein NOF04DRAFT_1327058, partial [Fusarium oxysporum II5]